MMNLDRAEIIIPSPALKPFVHHYWIMKARANGMSQIIMPVGCMKWMFHRKRPLDVNGKKVNEVASVVGIYDKAITIRAAEETEMISVFFQPYVAKMVMHRPINEFFDQSIDFDSLEDRRFCELKEKILDAPTIDDAISKIESFILQRVAVAQGSSYQRPLARVFVNIMSHPEVHTSHLASVACMCERQFRRVFAENIGVAPKQLLRIYRFHAATNEMMSLPGESFDVLLYKYGYTDHSHFNRDFHDIAGISPTAYISYLQEVASQGMIQIYCSYHAQNG